MLFQTVEFAVFFCCVAASYFLVSQRRRLWILLFASYYFYMAWDYRFSVLMLGSTLIDYSACRGIDGTSSSAKRRLYLIVSVVFNLAILGCFKYFGFFTRIANDIAALTGRSASFPIVNFILPIGISFYTFQSMSMTIDVYRGKCRAERSLLKFALYVAFFPQLVAGPIVRATDFLPQLNRRIKPHATRIFHGLQRFLIGLVKKVVIADNLAVVADLVFDNPGEMDTGMLWLGALCFSIQIYADFSGYSDMAIGVARILGFRFLENFNMPYCARSPSEFWRRWHISLSSWLRDYLYISLGGNRKGTAKTYRNLMLTMLLGGLWHGASYNFILWGGLHGIYLVIQRLLAPVFEPVRRRVPTLHGVLSWFVLQLAVLLAWVPFRATSLSDTLVMLRGMFVYSYSEFLRESLIGVDFGLITFILVIVIAAHLVGYFKRSSLLSWSRTPVGRVVATAALVFLVVQLRFDGDVPFIYFQF